MFWLLLALMTGYALHLPVTLQADTRRCGRTQTRLQLHLAGIRKTWLTSNLRSAGLSSRHRNFLTLLRHTDQARHFLLSHTKLHRLDILLLLRTEDAARTALITGMLRTLAHPHRRNIRICIQPDFFRGHSTMHLRCIIRWKLGTLLLTSMMLLAAYIRRRITESEA